MMLNTYSEVNQNLIAQMLEYGIINSTESANSLVEMMKLKEKEKFVLEKISGTLPQEPNFKGGTLYRKVIKKNGIATPFTSTTYNGLIAKLYDYYAEDEMDYSFAAIFHESLDYRRKTIQLSENTYLNYETDYRTYITEDLGDKDIRLITKDFLKEYTKSLLQRKKLKEKAFLGYKTILNIVFDYAIEQDYLLVNPAKSIKIKQYARLIDFSKPTPEEKIFTSKELQRIEEHIRSRMKKGCFQGFDYNGYGILLSMLSGVRVGELCALQWDDVFFDQKIIRIRRQQIMEPSNIPNHNKYYFANWTKDERGISQGGREFPLYKELEELLLEIKEKQKELGIISDYIICNREGHFIYKTSFGRALYELCKKLGFHVTNNHAFRMTLNSKWEPYFSASARASYFGHTVETNLAHYTYHNGEDLFNNIEKINEIMKDNQVTPR